jgi:hypothetical protein
LESFPSRKADSAPLWQSDPEGDVDYHACPTCQCPQDEYEAQQQGAHGKVLAESGAHTADHALALVAIEIVGQMHIIP